MGEREREDERAGEKKKKSVGAVRWDKKAGSRRYVVLVLKCMNSVSSIHDTCWLFVAFITCVFRLLVSLIIVPHPLPNPRP